MKDTLPNLSGKYIRFTIRGSEDNGASIVDPHFEMQGGRLFIVGTIPKGGSSGDWLEGISASIAWEDVTDYLLFDSVEHFADCEAKYDKSESD